MRDIITSQTKIKEMKRGIKAKQHMSTSLSVSMMEVLATWCQSRVEGSLLRAQLLSQVMEKAEISPEEYKSNNLSKLLKIWSEG